MVTDPRTQRAEGTWKRSDRYAFNPGETYADWRSGDKLQYGLPR